MSRKAIDWSGAESRAQPRRFSIWPFEPIGSAGFAVVEILPRWFALAAGSATDVKRPGALRAAPAAFDASTAAQDPLGEDEADSVLSAARYVAGSAASFTAAFFLGLALMTDSAA